MDTNRFPLMLYKYPGAEPIHGAHFDTHLVNNETEQAAAILDGWYLTTREAKAAEFEKTFPVVDKSKLKEDENPIPQPAGAVPNPEPPVQTDEITTGVVHQPAEDATDAEKKAAAQPTREELLQMAKELGLVHARKISDEKLAELVNDAVEQRDGKTGVKKLADE